LTRITTENIRSTGIAVVAALETVAITGLAHIDDVIATKHRAIAVGVGGAAKGATPIIGHTVYLCYRIAHGITRVSATTDCIQGACVAIITGLDTVAIAEFIGLDHAIATNRTAIGIAGSIAAGRTAAIDFSTCTRDIGMDALHLTCSCRVIEHIAGTRIAVIAARGTITTITEF
tara:strand:+ start:200 stop:724 length:525 start_codon:yes stop_codon:yes gene_type:complete